MTEVVAPPAGAVVRLDGSGLPRTTPRVCTVASMSPRKMAYKRYMRHKGAVVCTVIMAILLVIVILAPWIAAVRA